MKIESINFLGGKKRHGSFLVALIVSVLLVCRSLVVGYSI